MSNRLRVAIFIIISLIIIDGWAWLSTLKIHNQPSPEELRLAAESEIEVNSSSVDPIGDNFKAVIPLNGPWKYKQTGSGIENLASIDLDTTDWHTMEIPNNWYLSGLNYHGIVWFRTSFQSDPKWQGRLIRIKFDGVDYFADAWLNGVKIGQHEGYFQPFMFDVTDQLNYQKENILVVQVNSPYEEYKKSWPFHKTLIKGIFDHSHTRPGSSWDPSGQEYNTGGIWNDVSLLVSDFITIEDVNISATWPTTQTVNTDPIVNVVVRVENHADKTINTDLILKFIPKNHSGRSISLPARSATIPRGQNTIRLSGIVNNPLLWWTWDRGEPNLYTARLEIFSESTTIADKEITFGFRQILVSKDWHWILNGERFFPRGANYISSQWLSETNRDWFTRDIQLIKDANLNIIRLPAHVEPEEFYKIMDEKGLLIWQDFPLQWGYSDAPAFIDEAQLQLEDMIELLFNHPSIAVWCTHNEGPADMPWLADKDDSYNPSQNRRLDTILYNLAINLDQTRYIHKNSGMGDSHVYIGWQSGQWLNYGDWSFGRTSNANTNAQTSEIEISLPGAPFVTEYGAQALPNLEMMSSMFMPEELTYGSGELRDRWLFHNFQPIETFTIAQIDQGESIESFIQASQDYQANLIQFATESYRRAKYHPMQGIFYAGFVDSWPSIGYSVLDYDRQPKSGYFALKKAMQPILPSINPSKPSGLEGRAWVYERASDFWASLWVINDTRDSYPNSKFNWQLEDGTGRQITFGQLTVDVKPDSSQQVWTISSTRILEGNHQISVTLSSEDGQLLGENSFQFVILPQTEDIEE